MQMESIPIMKRGVKCNGHPIRHLMRIKKEQSPQRQQHQRFVQHFVQNLELKREKWDSKVLSGTKKLERRVTIFTMWLIICIGRYVWSLCNYKHSGKCVVNIAQIAMKSYTKFITFAKPQKTITSIDI